MRFKHLYLIVSAIIVILAITPYSRNYIRSTILYLSSPVSSFLIKVKNPFSKIITGVSELNDLKNNNNELSSKLIELEVDSSYIHELEVENANLKNQLGFIEEHREMELIPAKIIGREPTNYLDHIIVDRGKDDGVKEGVAVISEGALIGKVGQVTNNQSKIILITSKDSIIQAMLEKSRTCGILKGSLSGITLENIPQDISVEKGERIITSGLGGSISQGIVIGQVAQLMSSKAEIFKILGVNPLVDFSRLELVFIIK